MGIEWLESVCGILRSAGIRAGEAYHAGKMQDITEPVACVSLAGMESFGAAVTVDVQILSPRRFGAWRCQQAAVQALEALEAEGIGCSLGKCQYLAGSDCFAVTVSGTAMREEEDQPAPQISIWNVWLDGTAVLGISDFTAEQDRQRRMIGSMYSGTPTVVIPGKGGWTIRLVQKLGAGVQEAEPLAEPFSLRVIQDGYDETYSGCYWDQIQRIHSDDGMKVVRMGFALNREVTGNG